MVEAVDDPNPDGAADRAAECGDVVKRELEHEDATNATNKLIPPIANGLTLGRISPIYFRIALCVNVQ